MVRWIVFVSQVAVLLFSTVSMAFAEKVVFSGTSITCGSGASSYQRAFPSLVVAQLTKNTGKEFDGSNTCVGGAVSLAQLVSLREKGLPQKPDLLIIEAGTLDRAHETTLGAAALESMFRLAITNRIPTLALYPWTDYAALDRRDVEGLATRYGIPLVDIQVSARREKLKLDDITTDKVHVNDRGHALLARAIVETIQRTNLLNSGPSQRPVGERITTPDLDKLRFVPAVRNKLLEITASLVVVLMKASNRPNNLSFRVDGSTPKSVSQPGWLLTHTLLYEPIREGHVIEFNLAGGAEISGFLVQ